MRPLQLAALLLLPLPLAVAQRKEGADKARPKVILARPFGVAPGKTTRVALRGLKLDGAKEVKVAARGAAVKLLTKGKAGVPPQMDAARVGDTQAEVELTLPADVAGDGVELSVVTDAGAATHTLLVDRTAPDAEKEPNDGFKQAQAVKLGRPVEGGIGRAQDVDVYRFEAKAGERVILEVSAARLGSALDSLLKVYDADGQEVATADDSEGSTDSRLELTLAKGGAYRVSLTDAHDQGGPLHPYRLVIRAK